MFFRLSLPATFSDSKSRTQLLCEGMMPTDDVSIDAIEQMLTSDAFGKYAMLARSTSHFILATSDWQPTDEYRNFAEAHDSDPWVIELRDGHDNRQLRAEGYVTLRAVIHAFKLYLIGDEKWHTTFRWQAVPARLNRGRTRRST